VKIVFVGPVYPYRGGIAHFTASLAAAASKAGHEIEVISFKRQYPKFLYPGKSDQDPSINAVSVPAKFLLDPLYPWTWEQASREIIQSKPDLVVFQWWTTFWAPAFGILARRLKHAGVKSIFLLHNVYPHEAKFWDKAFAKFALNSADSFLAMAKSQQDLLASLFPDKQICISAHPIYQFASSNRIDRNTARKQLGIPLDREVAIFFGIVRPYKGLRLLVEAVGMMKREGNPVHLLIAGEFWENFSEYQQLFEHEGLGNWVTVQNCYIPNEDIPLYFGAADVFVAPYVGGTQSGAVKLALGYGIPIVLTPGIMDEMMSTGEKQNLFVSSSTDSASLIEPIKFALQTKSIKDYEFDSDETWHDLIKTLANMSQ